MGLAYIAIQQYDKAINKFDTAINISSKNPLYYCNLASTYLNKGDRTKAQNTYEAAAKLLKEPLDSEGLTKDNIKFIDKTLSKFLDNLKKLQQVKSDDPDLNKRINRFGESLTKTMESGLDNAKEIPSQKTPEQEAKLIIDSSKILEMVKSPGK
jgi:tetratricopeptide (TPR) repeat protein